MPSDEDLRTWMRMAVDLGKKSVSENALNPHVGAVVVKNGEVIGSGYRGKTGEGDHAEYGVLTGLADIDLTGALVFTTLEPCSRRNHPKIPCARRLAEANVGDVWVGIYDPNPVIYRRGWKILRDAGVKLHDFPADLRDEIANDNAAFVNQYKVATGDAGQVTFDSHSTASGITVKTSIGDFKIDTSPMGAGSVWIYGHQKNLAEARYCNEFDEIDDPGVFGFGDSRYVALGYSQMVCLRNENGYLLLKNVSDREPNVIDLLYQVRGSAQNNTTPTE